MFENVRSSRSLSFLVIGVVYVLAIVAGAVSYVYVPVEGFLWRLLVADVVGTVVVFFFSVLLRNSSVYDPYWSVAPVVMVSAVFFLLEPRNVASILMWGAIMWWGVRLTMNWAINFHGLCAQDWRYDKYRDETGRWWPVVNFFGIHLMPTLVVFLAMIPAFVLIEMEMLSNVWTFVGFGLSVGAAYLQLEADSGSYAFRRLYPGKVCDRGLWRYSRHPNYLGEILMWWGVYFMMLSVLPGYWCWGIGAVANTCLFVFISIPLMEKRQLASKPEYAAYRAKTGALFPRIIFKKHT